MAFASSNTVLNPFVATDVRDSASLGSNRWEGVVVADIEYARKPGAVSARIVSSKRLPLVYAEPQRGGDRPQTLDAAGGFSAAVSEARASPSECLVLSGEDPGSFFQRRAKIADESIRAKLRTCTPEAIERLSQSLKRIADSCREYETAVVAHTSTQTSSMPISRAAPKAPFVDRTEPVKHVMLFAEGALRHRVLVVCGPAGIGKRELINVAQQQDSQREKWLRFRCVEDSTFAETLAQLYVRLGIPSEGAPPLDLETYDHLWQHLATQQERVLIIEDAQHLPIFESDVEHTELMSCLSVLCRQDFTHIPRVILVSELRGHFAFSHSHLLDVLRLDGLTEPDTVQMLRELTSYASSQYPPPTTSELTHIARRIHGHPVLGQIVVSLLERLPTAEVADSLHEREEVRQYVINRLLGKASLGPAENRFLALASVFRQPVHISAFRDVSGSGAREIAGDLADRFLLSITGGMVVVHPLLADHFISQRTSGSDRVKCHKMAFAFYEKLFQRRHLSQDERIERVYQGVKGRMAVPLQDIQEAVGPVRTAMFAAMRNREWDEVIRTGDLILGIHPHDPIVRVAKATSLDAVGRDEEADQYFDSVAGLDKRHAWLGVEFARSRIRRRDLDGADRILSELEHKFGTDTRVQLARVQLLEAQGLHDDAVAACEEVLKSQACRERDAFYAGLMLRHANALDRLIEYVEERCDGTPSNRGLTRLYAYACVITGYAPAQGLDQLGRLYSEDPGDGYTVADYGSSLAKVGRTADAKNVFEKGLSECKGPPRNKVAILTEYADFLDVCQAYSASHDKYRQLIRMRRYDLHTRRRFATSLLSAAAEARGSRNREREDACVQEAITTLRSLLEIAPQDRWAADLLNKAEQRLYS